MPRYKLRPIAPGEVVHLDDGTQCAVADTINEARDLFEDWNGERPMYLHPAIARHRVVYKRDVDNGDCHEDAEPGETTFTVLPDGELADCDARVWLLGAPDLAHWQMKPLPREPIVASEIPTGTTVHHRRLGSGRTTAPGRAIGAWWYLDVAWGYPEPTVEKVCKVSLLSVMPGAHWPPVTYRLEINGEHVADGSEKTLRALLAIREARLRAEWEAEHFDAAAVVLREDED